jgi:predicted Zn-dependent peptidase
MKTFTLENGLTVILHQIPEINRTRAQILYHFGSGVEASRAERGLAHVVEHMILKGTEADRLIDVREVERTCPHLAQHCERELVSRGELEEIARAHSADVAGDLTRCGALYLSEADIDSIGRHFGASLNAFTSLEKTSYFFETGRGNIDPFLKIFANSACASAFKDDHINSEIKAVLQEMKMGNDNPERMGFQKSMEMLYGPNEVGHLSTIGSELDLMKLSSEVVRDFFFRHYRPWNATLFVVGDFDPKEVEASVHNYFSHIALEEHSLHREVEAISEKVYSESPPASAARDLSRLRDRLGEGPLGRHLARRCDTMAAALENKSTVNPAALASVPPAPCAQTHVMYENVQSPTWIFSWRIPPLPSAVTRAFELVLTDGPRSRLHQGLVKRGLASEVSAFADQHSHAGGFFVVVKPGPTAALATVRSVIVQAVKRPVGADTLRTLNNKLKTEWACLHESVTDLTTAWVYDYAATGDPQSIFRAPSVGRVDAFQGAFSEGTGNVVQISPMPAEMRASSKARAEIRQGNAQLIGEIKKRVTPLEEPHSLHLMGEATPLERLSMPSLETRGEHTALGHPITQLYREVRAPPLRHHRALARSLEGPRFGVAMQCLAQERDLGTLEGAGAVVSIGEACSLTLPWASRDLETCKREFARQTSINPPLQSAEALATAVSSAVCGIRAQMDSADAVAMHEMTNEYLRGPGERYTLEEAAQAVGAMDLGAANALLQKYFARPAVTAVRPGKAAETGPSAAAAPGPLAERGGAPSVERHIPMARAQTVVALARPGSCDLSDPVRAMVVNDLLYHICFHSLGSRLYKIRERTGLFYGARAQFSVGATAEDPGFDYIMTRVEPVDVERVKKEFRGLFRQMAENPGIEERELEAAKRWFENKWVQGTSSARVASTIRTLRRLYPGEWRGLPQRLVAAAGAVDVASIEEACRGVFKAPWAMTLTVG